MRTKHSVFNLWEWAAKIYQMVTYEFESRLKEALQKNIEKHVFPGCAVGVVSRSGAQLIVPMGAHSYKEPRNRITESSIFDVASITKAIPTSMLALKAIEEGRMRPGTPLCTLVPEFGNTFREPTTVWHLLTQTIDHGYALSSCKSMSATELLHVLLTHEFRCPPGEWFGYTNATSILLGMCVERAFGMTLDCLAQEIFFSPLEMAHTTFSPERFPRDQFVPTEFDEWRGRLIQGEVHDESAFVLRQIMVPGSAGLFSTAPDLLKFLRMILNGGKAGNVQVFSPETIGGLAINQLDGIGKCGALGWELNQVRYMGSQCSPRTIGKTGFTGCMVMCDFDAGRAMVFLSNHIFPKRRGAADVINACRREIADIVFEK